MDERSRRFSVDKVECVLVLDGYHDYPDPGTSFFANAPTEEVEAWLRARGDVPETWKVYRSPYPALVLFNGEETILIDTGAGSYFDTTGRLIENLEREGVSPDQVDTVILTHAHPDHVGGNVDSKGRPVFSRARHVIQRTEWEFWMGGASEKACPERFVTAARAMLGPLEGSVDLIDGDVEIAPGVRSLLAPGHTPGHMCVDIGSGKERLVYVSDLILLPHHLERPEWFYRAEVNPKVSLETRRRLCSQIALDRVLVQAFHFEWPGLGYFIPRGDTWIWQAAG